MLRTSQGHQNTSSRDSGFSVSETKLASITNISTIDTPIYFPAVSLGHISGPVSSLELLNSSSSALIYSNGTWLSITYYSTPHIMIRFFLLQNRQGKTRLSKWYAVPPSDTERVKLEADVNRVVAARSKSHTNFVEYQNYKLIYRRYAGLYFIFGADSADNELLLMETIHLFVELLDQYFSNVCELDIVFHFNKVYAILDEYILAGEVQESNKRVILERMKELEKLE